MRENKVTIWILYCTNITATQNSTLDRKMKLKYGLSVLSVDTGIMNRPHKLHCVALVALCKSSEREVGS